MIRNSDTVASIMLNGTYLGSFRAQELNGQIGLGAANDNHVLFDDVEVNTIEGERILAKATEEKKQRAEKPEREDKPASPMQYRVSRRVPVLAHPSPEAQLVAWAQEGMAICVISVTDRWLEVRSTKGRPPGFIHRNDAVPTGWPCHSKQ